MPKAPKVRIFLAVSIFTMKAPESIRKFGKEIEWPFVPARHDIVSFGDIDFRVGTVLHEIDKGIIAVRIMPPELANESECRAAAEVLEHNGFAEGK